jgi:hypothetical protein
MSADPLAIDPVSDLLDRSRALRLATADVLAESRATFCRVLEQRAQVRAEIARLGQSDGYWGAA